ncbi:nonribosomal peptide synthetase MxaA [Methylicorpusculum oleiharenae]|uniref:nonribosomal peptide synthetase MxaA n=1 Tax=Methylicorpusculum oleiharenae TaxID=1338687 RepID=UPI001356E3DE|nr:nonribosomal peptide synthetase MxaA [Methylicorpusculum oleiharenae]MCD2452725.1 nonribosomal peptide synthetase MxaA [Methylicorpusculum oleiharenae]
MKSLPFLHCKDTDLSHQIVKYARSILVYSLFLLVACSEGLPPPIERFEFETPKPFGYVIGDKIRHRIVIGTRSGIQLEPTSLPAKGDLNRWLSIDQITVRPVSKHLTEIELTYQVFYAPLEVKMLTIAGFKLRFKQGDQAIEQVVPEWSFTVSPIHELAVRKEEGNTYRRPDATPTLISSQNALRLLSISVASGLFCGLLLAFRYGYFVGFPRRSFFSRANGRIKKMQPNELGLALVIIHQAFNQLNHKPLFKHRLSEFYRLRPEFKEIGPELEWFFNFSNDYFFGGKPSAGADEWDALKKMCQRCVELERG